jgi:hypothetical protein
MNACLFALRRSKIVAVLGTTLVVLAAVSLIRAEGAATRPPAVLPATPATKSPAAPGDDKPLERLREGAPLTDCPGTFKPTGDRLTFFAQEGRRRLVVLENLNLERIYRVMADNPAQLQWMVTGTVTEFRGVNYLLVERARHSSLRSTQQDAGALLPTTRDSPSTSASRTAATAARPAAPPRP